MSDTSWDGLVGEDAINFVACTLVQRRKAAIQEGVKKFHLCLWLVSILQFFFPVVCVSLIEHLLNLVILLTSGTCGIAVLTTPLKDVKARRQNSLLSSFSVRSELIVLHNASAMAHESATRIQIEWHSCFQSCLDSCETVAALDKVARTPQSHEHVLVVSCTGAS